jgi:hypothetical protein
MQPGGGKADDMTDPADLDSGTSARGEAAWKQATEEVAARNRRAQQAGREERETSERERYEARRAAEARAHARLVGRSDARTQS